MRLNGLVVSAVIGLSLCACEPEDTGGGGGVGGKIAFERENDIWVAGDDGNGEKKLTTDGVSHNPAFSPDGRSIVFEHAGTELLVVPAAGGATTQLASTSTAGESYKNPHWAGDVVVFQISLSGQPDRVARVAASGGPVTDLVSGGAYFPTLNKAANTVLLTFGSIPNQSLGTVGITGGNPTSLQGSASEPGRAVFSPDGTKIAFAAKDGSLLKIFVAEASGQNAKKVAGTQSNDTWPAFSPDGTLLAFTSPEGGQEAIYQVPVDGSKPFDLFLAGKNPTWGP